MPLVEISNAKGLVQKTGEGLVAVPGETQALTGNDALATISTDSFYVRVSPGDARTGARLTAGSVDGQLLLVSNIDTDNAHTITFAAAGTSLFTLGVVALDAGESMLCIWDKNLDGGRWVATSQSLA